jgi:DNA-binding NarL/FixJ family response regulator
MPFMEAPIPFRPQGRDRATVWLVEDNDLYRDTIAGVLRDAPGVDCALAVSACEEALSAVEAGEVPDIVLMDIGLPQMDGIEGTRLLRQLSPSTRVIMLTVHDEEDKIFEAICAGASGYLLKPLPLDRLLAALSDVAAGAAPINGYIASKILERFATLASPRGDYGLTDREREILTLLVDGLVMKQIASRLAISYHTVDTHVRNIYDKLHVHSRAEAVAKAVRERLL